ncbi:PAS domain-containing protein [Massilia solisilvae]|uniref:histidine kinase n=1 Tax=Massilia solisilvae TaxID=1811225 RepID=A0ABT2BMA2_9BURK|nr:PAS domain-containing protein [Massilia solisilvae]MCS0609642.1 PAS domain-containing protein [Massilia solisilvae]
MFRRQRLPSIRSKLFTLILACALPILIGYIAFARDAGRREREHVAQDAQTVAQALVAAVDRELASSETAARVLANSYLLSHGRLAEFHANARNLLRPEFPAHAFALADAEGREILNTRFAYGSKIPPSGARAEVKRVFATGESVATGLRTPGPDPTQVLSIIVPVWREGKVVYALSVQMRPKPVADLLASQHLPDQWMAQVFDNQQRLVASNADLTATQGTPLPAAVAQALARRDIGIAPLGKDADAEFAAFARSREHRWTVAVTVPRDAAPLMLGHPHGAILTGVAALLAVSLGLAWLIGGSIARSVRALIGPAQALGRGEAVVIPKMAIAEADAVADALRQVDRKLARYRRGLATLVNERTAELERSTALLETVYASAPVGLCFMDRELRFVMINDYLAAINAVPASEHIGRTLPEVLGPVGEQLELDYRRVLESGRPMVDLESVGGVPAAPGVMRHWLASYYPVFGPDREIVGINAVVLDITERKLQEQRNRDNEELFRALYEGSGDAHTLLAYGAGFVSANRAAAALFGFDEIDELLALSPASVSPQCQPDGRLSEELMRQYMRQVMDTGGAHFEWQYRRRDGSTFHADVVLTSVDIGGKGMMQGTMRDISSRVAAETALRATSERLARNERFIRTVTDHLPGMVGYWDADLRCRFANRPYLQWLGRSEEQVFGERVQALIAVDQLDQVNEHIHAVLAGRAQSFERQLHMRSGELVHAWGNYIPDFDEQGTVRGFYVLYTDVTELKRTQGRLVQALREAEHASSAKGQFLANMSHEIRTPMNAIMGLARLLEEAPLGRRERGYVERMQLAAKSLLGMLSDVLDFSKVEAGQLVLERQPFLLDDVLATVAAVAASNAWAKGVEPVFDVDGAVPRSLVGDQVRLGQVLLNLAANAIKFTDKGEVVLAVRAAGFDAGTVRLAFSVRDTGIGIAPDQQERMFEAFSQADSSISRKYGGAGLGLAICRRLVELMGGQLRVDSAPGLGATFSFELAFPLAPHTAALPCPDAAQAVLVADDNPSALAALAGACEAFGWQVDRADGGAAALALLRAGRRYDLAFLDSAMPDLDGASVLAYARSDQSIRLPRCALAAADPERERLAALADDLHVDALLAKPFTRRALLETVAELCSGAAPAPARPIPLAGRLAGLRVLLVEDNVINQEVANYALVHAGASVDIAENGQMALSMLSERSVQYDAVLMDLQMPVMNGYDATGAIRAMGLDRLPIIAMTANAMEEDRRRALAAGMDAHLAKPIEVDVLVETLLAVAGRAAGGAADAAAPAAWPAPPSIPGIDLKATLPRFGGAFANFAAVFRRFESSQGRTLDEVRELLRSGDRKGAQQLAHRLRGVAANLGANEVAALALDFEQALRSADEAALALRLARLDAALSVVLDASREIDAAGAGAEPGVPAATCAQREDLIGLLDLLHNNNLKAMAQFDALRPALAGLLDAKSGDALADAIGTLRFDVAAALLQDILNGKIQA